MKFMVMHKSDGKEHAISHAADVDRSVEGLAEPVRAIAERTRSVVDAALPDVPAGLWHGHPAWSTGAPGKGPVCLVKAYAGYVTLGFWKGQALTDPSGRLEAGSREMASAKLRSLDDIDQALFNDRLRQARDLEAPSK